MLETVFISDLHLHPQRHDLLNKFHSFIDSASGHNIASIYILGDLFHAWAGDDCIDAWHINIADQFKELSQQGIKLYFMPGNRDFLLGDKFAAYSNLQLLNDPTLIKLGDEDILLAHGDKYCLLDKSHQKFRLLTRNRIFTNLFLRLPRKLRLNIVMRIRKISANANQHTPKYNCDVVPAALITELFNYNSRTIIHGHTHIPGLTSHLDKVIEYRQFVLSDWDDHPQ